MVDRALDQEYIERLHELHDAEEAVVKELRDLVSGVSSPELRGAFEYCLEQSQEYLHHTRLLLDRARQRAGRRNLAEPRSCQARVARDVHRLVFRYSRWSVRM